MKVLALHAGAAREIAATGTGEWWDKDWRSGFVKSAQSGSVWLGYEASAEMSRRIASITVEWKKPSAFTRWSITSIGMSICRNWRCLTGPLAKI